MSSKSRLQKRATITPFIVSASFNIDEDGFLDEILSDNVSVSDTPSFAWQINPTQSDTVVFSDVVNTSMEYQLDLSDTISITDTEYPNTIADTVTFDDSIGVSIELNLSDTIAMSDDLQQSMKLTLADTSSITDVETPTLF